MLKLNLLNRLLIRIGQHMVCLVKKFIAPDLFKVLFLSIVEEHQHKCLRKSSGLVVIKWPSPCQGSANGLKTGLSRAKIPGNNRTLPVKIIKGCPNFCT